MQVQRAAELSTADRLNQLASATFVEAGKALGRLDRDYLILPPSWLQELLSDLDFGMHGEFFVDGPTATSPVQGALGDCWLIAAMASVAWTHSQLISERTRRENIVGAVDPGDADLFFELTDVLTIPVLFFTITIPFVFQQWIGERLPQSCRRRRDLRTVVGAPARTGRPRSRRRSRSGAAAATPTTRAAVTTPTSTAATPLGQCTS